MISLWFALAFAGPADSAWELGFTKYAAQDWEGAHAAWVEVQKLEPKRADLSFWLAASETRARLAKRPIPKDPAPPANPGKTLKITAVGDVMMGSDLKKGEAGLAPDNGIELFADAKAIFEKADIAFVNLEGPLADGLPSTKCGPQSTSCYAFRTPTRYASTLKAASVDVASLANNHAWDLGVPGQESTMKALDAQGIAHAGRFGDVAILERNGQKIAFVAAHSGECCLNVNEIAEVQRAIGEADELADIVVFSFHGGMEGAGARHVPGKTEIAWGERRGDTKALSRAAIDAGADLVLSHGPHVLRAMEVYRDRLIAYSLGNFMGFRQFGTGGCPTGTSLILEADLAPNGALVQAKIHPMALDKQSIPRTDSTGEAIKHIRELSAADFPETGVKVADDGTLSWR